MKQILNLIKVCFTSKDKLDKEALVMETRLNRNALELNGVSNHSSHDPVEKVL